MLLKVIMLLESWLYAAELVLTIHNHNLRSGQLTVRVLHKGSCIQHSFHNTAKLLWNNLTKSIRESRSIENFKENLRQFFRELEVKDNLRLNYCLRCSFDTG